jgi:hypothetical protein
MAGSDGVNGAAILVGQGGRHPPVSKPTKGAELALLTLIVCLIQPSALPRGWQWRHERTGRRLPSIDPVAVQSIVSIPYQSLV